MNVTKISAVSDVSVFSHTDKVTGVLANRHELDALKPALEALGVAAVEVLEGASGAIYLYRKEQTLHAFLDTIFGDLETETRRLYAGEIEQGRLVFAIQVTPENKDAVVEAVLAHGATHVVHFGTWISTSFEQHR